MTNSTRWSHRFTGKLHRALLASYLCAGTLLLLGCDGAQSALAPAGREAEEIARLFWWMTAGAIIIWLAVVALGIYAVRVRPELFNERRARLLIIGGGAIVPTAVLAGLLAY